MIRAWLLLAAAASSGCIVVHRDSDHELECDEHRDCAWDEVCHAGDCVRALDRVWEVTVLTASVGDVHPDGEEWDPEGGAPDLLVSMGLSEDDICLTATRPDTYAAEWNTWCDFRFPYDGTFYFEVYDEDHDDYELGAGWSWEGSDALMELVRTSGRPETVIDETDTVTASLAVNPAF